MKKARVFHLLICISLLILTVSVSLASPPERLNYQGVLKDNNGNRINATVIMTFNIYDQQSGGNLQWGPETIANVQVSEGLFSVALGETVPISSSLFSSGSRYISVTVNGELMSPRQLINSVPYALNAISSGVIVMWSGSIANIPGGWALCDGNNGTPDLRSRFLVGAGSEYAVGATGGVQGNDLSHSHTVNSHTHTITVESPATNSAGSHSHPINLNTGGPGGGDPTDQAEDGTGERIASETHIHNVSGNAGAEGNHSHTVNSHSHGSVTGGSTSGTDSKLSATVENRPPYYALCFIMKL